jgi:hypothetical protein
MRLHPSRMWRTVSDYRWTLIYIAIILTASLLVQLVVVAKVFQ